MAIVTFKLPPRSVAVHPGPSNGVAVAWRSPVTGMVQYQRPAWRMPTRWAAMVSPGSSTTAAETGVTELAAGDFANGGKQRLDQGRGAERLKRVSVKAGDRIELLVLPRANHGWDTTVVELKIALGDGSKVWDLAADVLGDVHQGNPHADRFGNAAVWHFLDMADSRRGQRPGALAAALAGWDRAAMRGDRAELERAAASVAKNFPAEDAASPFRIGRQEEGNLPAAVRTALAKLDAEIAAQKGAAPRFPMPMALRKGECRAAPTRASMTCASTARSLRPPRRTGAAPLSRDPRRPRKEADYLGQRPLATG